MRVETIPSKHEDACPPPRPPTVGYLTKRFPRLSETFILDEILGLEAAGVPLRLYSIADPRESLVQPDVGRVRSPVRYLRSGPGRAGAVSDYLRFATSHLVLARRDPRRWCGVVGHIALHRRHASTMKHFMAAGALALELERANAQHIHAAFAHGPASIAHFVHLLTGMPFSFAAHAKDLYLSAPSILGMKVAASTFVLVCSASAASELTRIVETSDEATVRAEAGKIVLSPHGVDTDRFAPVAGRVGRGATAPLRILAVGRLVPKKGIPVLIDALADMAAAGVAFECRIVGGGELREQLARRAAAAGVADKVTFLGSRAQPQILAEYHWADVFVQASVVNPDGDRDGIPNSVMEAMASGVAVVASAVAGIPEVVRHDVTGILVAPGDAPALAKALRELAGEGDRRRRLGRDASLFANERLSRRGCLEPVAARFLATLGRVPAGAGPTTGA